MWSGSVFVMATRTDLSRSILELSARTLNVVHARDLRAAGVSRDAVANRVAGGWMAPVVGRTYAVGPDCQHPPFPSMCMAGVMAGGSGSFIDDLTAASLLDLWNRRTTAIHVSVPWKSCSNARGPFRFHRGSRMWLPDEDPRVGPIPVGNMQDVVASCSRRATSWQVAFMMQRGIYLDLCTLATLEEFVLDRAGVPGNATAQAAVRLVQRRSYGTRGVTEDAVLGDMLGAGVPVPVVNTRGIMGMSRDEADFVWLDTRRNLEVDGPHHDVEPQLSDDRARDAEALERGWSVLRVATGDFWRRRTYVMRQVLRFLAGTDVELVLGTRRLRVP